MQVIKHTQPKARKTYYCDACATWLVSGLRREDVTAKQWAVVKKAEADDWRILAGMKYHYQLQKDGGDLYAFRGRQDMVDLVSELKLWDDW